MPLLYLQRALQLLMQEHCSSEGNILQQRRTPTLTQVISRRLCLRKEFDTEQAHQLWHLDQVQIRQ